MGDAVLQAITYLNSNGVGSRSHVKTKTLGAPGKFKGEFTIFCVDTVYLVEYYTPIHGAILYEVTELGKATQPAYAYDYVFEYETKEESILDRKAFSWPSLGLNYHMFLGAAGVGIAGAIMVGVQRLYTNQSITQ